MGVSTQFNIVDRLTETGTYVSEAGTAGEPINYASREVKKCWCFRQDRHTIIMFQVVYHLSL